MAALDELAGGEGHSVLDLAFGWLLSRPPWPRSSPAPRKPEQIAANVAAGAWRPGADVLAAVDTIAPADGSSALRPSAPVAWPRARTGARWTNRL